MIAFVLSVISGSPSYCSVSTVALVQFEYEPFLESFVNIWNFLFRESQLGLQDTLKLQLNTDDIKGIKTTVKSKYSVGKADVFHMGVNCQALCNTV